MNAVPTQFTLTLDPPAPNVRRDKPRARSIGLIDLPRAARNDPSTSHIAAARIKASGALGKQQQLVLDAVRHWPGMTSGELAHKLAVADGKHWSEVRPMMARRLPELAVTMIRKSAERECVITGSICVTWVPLP